MSGGTVVELDALLRWMDRSPSRVVMSLGTAVALAESLVHAGSVGERQTYRHPRLEPILSPLPARIGAVLDMHHHDVRDVPLWAVDYVEDGVLVAEAGR